MKSDRSAGQSAPEVKKSQKHEVNLRKNSSLYFQVGLILCLLATFALFEMQFKTTNLEIAANEIIIDEPITIPFDKFKIYKPKAEVQKQEPKVTKLIDVYKPLPDHSDDFVETIITPEVPQPTSQPMDRGELDNLPTEPEEDFWIGAVEIAPIYPGCEKYSNNEDRKKCMSEKISKLVQRKFDTELASEYGLSGIQRIQTQFVVDKSGLVTGIKIRAPHPRLEAEAQRVINKIPQMEPGKQQGKEVNVIYSLPITFKVQN
ncbi:energy transducer TonB [Winogradskyella maritima]|uniref:Energy transducer TonB n=1 Tax=Winogradskyella maritima TaxID=1517766 RepID=A0ABV8ACW8_9FLAO|nr:energy transducer TonB [Winogradskyella maritima]